MPATPAWTRPRMEADVPDLVQCVACGGLLRKGRRSCPHCGPPWPSAGRVALGIAAAASLAACGPLQTCGLPGSPFCPVVVEYGVILLDAGHPPSALDAGRHSGTDAGDAGLDAGPDAGPDAGEDAG
jgi:hypothetical protein